MEIGVEVEVEVDTGLQEEAVDDMVSGVVPTVHALRLLDMVLDIHMAALRITKNNTMDHGVQFNTRGLKIMDLGVQAVTEEMDITTGMAVDTTTKVPKRNNSGIPMEAIKEEVISHPHPGDQDSLPLIETNHSDIYLLTLQEMVKYYIILK